MTTARRWRTGWLYALWLPWLSACQAPPSATAPQATHAAIVRAELAQLVDSQKPPCGAVLAYTRHDRLDYRVECQSGRVYRVRVSADGHVMVTPYESP